MKREHAWVLAVVLATTLVARIPTAVGANAERPVPLDLVVDMADTKGADAVIDAQLGALAEVYAPHGLSFAVTTRRVAGPSLPRAIVTRADRDALAAELHPGAANVFFTSSLEDVDEANRHRFGVCWRNEADPDKRYVVVASYAPRGVLAHELGHLLGLSHTSTIDNVMSYTRSADKPPFFTRAQGETMRRTARDDFARGLFR